MLEVDIKLTRDSFSLVASQSFAANGVTAVFGPSGSGKTTLLDAIAGFAQADGTVRFDGEDLSMMRAYRRPFGYVFQDSRLFAHLDVAGNLGYAQSRAREARHTLPDIVETLDIRQLLNKRPHEISGGETKRVAIARALLTAPRLLLLDEPLAGIDQSRKREILPYLERVTAELEIPTIFVSHSIEEVARLADRVCVIDSGRLRDGGTLAEFLESADTQPLTPRAEAGVALPARITAVDAAERTIELDADGHRVYLPLEDPVEAGAATRVFIRARDVAIATQRPEHISIRNVIPATIERIEESDSPYVETFLRLNEHVLHARITRRALHDLSLAVGDDVYALVKSVSFDH